MSGAKKVVPPARTGEDVAAEVVAQLLYHGVIRDNRVEREKIRRLTGIDHPALARAMARRAKAGYKPFAAAYLLAPPPAPAVPQVMPWPIDDDQDQAQPGPTPTATPTPAPSQRPIAHRDVVPRPPDLKPARTTRPQRVTSAGVTELYCTGTDKHEPHWAPESEFMRRADRPHLRHTHCDVGRKAYQRARRVSVALRDNLSDVGISLVVDSDSVLVGLACADCGQPFAAEDLVRGDTRLAHQVCPPKAGQ